MDFKDSELDQAMRKRAGGVNMIFVMGVTGAGKSTFINSLAGTEQTEVGHRLLSCKIILGLSLRPTYLYL
jgi:ABC-type ATPase involved in cell division